LFSLPFTGLHLAFILDRNRYLIGCFWPWSFDRNMSQGALQYITLYIITPADRKHIPISFSVQAVVKALEH
jgi:hypothetical protein